MTQAIIALPSDPEQSKTQEALDPIHLE